MRLSQFSETYMLRMNYPSIRGGKLLDYAEKARWKKCHTYINSHSKRLIDEFTVDGVQDI